MQNATACSSGAMNRSRFAATRVIATLLVTVLMLSAAAQAASINYGNFGPVPPGVTFVNVTESSGTDNVPLFGPPTPFTTGLDFDPAGFVASASGGNQDITDGQLNFRADSIFGINTIQLFEAGDFSLTGVGTSATQAIAGAIIRATVTEINGVAVAPIVLSPSNASVSFNLVSNPGIVQPWSLGTTINIDGQLAPGQNATKVEISINNQLQALSQSTSAAFIAKKEFILNVSVVPEPTSLGLAAVGLLGLARRRRVSMN